MVLDIKYLRWPKRNHDTNRIDKNESFLKRQNIELLVNRTKMFHGVVENIPSHLKLLNF